MSFLSVDGTLFVQLLNFAIFFAILNFIFLRPVGRAVAKRRRYIESLAKDYEHYQSEANALRAQAQTIRAAARREAEQIMGSARAQASNEGAAIASEFGARANEIRQQSDQTVEQELAKARTAGDRSSRELADLILRRAVPELAS